VNLTKSELGHLSEAALIRDLIANKYNVLKPCVGHNYKYDLVIEISQGVFKTVQVKTGLYRNGVVEFYCCCGSIAEGHDKGDYKGLIDFFGVFCPELNKSYLVPVDDVGCRSAYLRVEDAKVKSSRTRLAINYELKLQCTSNGRSVSY